MNWMPMAVVVMALVLFGIAVAALGVAMTKEERTRSETGKVLEQSLRDEPWEWDLDAPEYILEHGPSRTQLWIAHGEGQLDLVGRSVTFHRLQKTFTRADRKALWPLVERRRAEIFGKRLGQPIAQESGVEHG